MRQELPSGAYIDVTPLPYVQAWDVAQSLLREIQKTDIDVKGLDVDQILVSDMIMLKGPFCALLGSPVVQNAVKLCFNRCTYGKSSMMKLDDSSFEPIEARGDYLFCAYYALKENVYPFFGSLVSLLNKK